MNWLTATLAFAIAMLLFTSMVSAIVETIQRLFGLRRRGLQWMLKALYADVARLRPDLLAPLAQAQQALNTPVDRSAAAPSVGAGAAASQPRTFAPGDFIEVMTANVQGREFRGWLPHFLRPLHVQSLTPVEFAQRLARTDIGAALKTKAEAEWRHLLDGVLERFDFFGQAAAETFRQRAKAISVIVSIVFAFALNINAVALFLAFANRPQLADAMLALREEAQRRFEEQEKIRAKAQEEGRQAPPDADATQAEVQKAVADLKLRFRALADLGLPIGWSSARCLKQVEDAEEEGDEFCSALRRKEIPVWPCDAPDAPCKTWRDQLFAAPSFAWNWACFPLSHRSWLLSTLLAGLLIGLGGPFWYNLCANLSRAAQLARSATQGLKESPPTGGGGAVAAPEAPLLSTPARAFAAAIILDEGKP